MGWREAECETNVNTVDVYRIIVQCQMLVSVVTSMTLALNE